MLPPDWYTVSRADGTTFAVGEKKSVLVTGARSGPFFDRLVLPLLSMRAPCKDPMKPGPWYAVVCSASLLYEDSRALLRLLYPAVAPKTLGRYDVMPIALPSPPLPPYGACGAVAARCTERWMVYATVVRHARTAAPSRPSATPTQMKTVPSGSVDLCMNGAPERSGTIKVGAPTPVSVGRSLSPRYDDVGDPEEADEGVMLVKVLAVDCPGICVTVLRFGRSACGEQCITAARRSKTAKLTRGR